MMADLNMDPDTDSGCAIALKVKLLYFFCVSFQLNIFIAIRIQGFRSRRAKPMRIPADPEHSVSNFVIMKARICFPVPGMPYLVKAVDPHERHEALHTDRIFKYLPVLLSIFFLKLPF